ncbi:hypothetical protein HKCCE2091_12805 [Rhodobacterales bacterium HKCCE2091]|nr:hypothetical protein [Rhodobacterales bacterium HKCCE2091]
METDGALVIDLRKPDWADDAPALIAAVAAGPKGGLRLEVDLAPIPSAQNAQLLWALTRHATESGLPVALAGDPGPLADGLGRLGFTDALPAEGDDAE